MPDRQPPSTATGPVSEYLSHVPASAPTERLVLALQRWRRSPVVTIGLVAIVAACALVGVDWLYRGIQAQSLISATRDSWQAMESTQREFERIALLTPRRPGGLTLDELDAVHREFDVAATVGTDRVRAAEESVRRLLVLPWHSDVREARSAYLSLTDAWFQFVDRARGDAMELAHPQGWVREQRTALQGSLSRAIPFPDVFSSADRVSAALDPGVTSTRPAAG